MSVELNLVFPDKDRIEVRRRTESGALEFTNPLTAKDREEIRWYLEVYGTHWSDEPDDIEARRIEGQLPIWGKALFDSVFSDSSAARIFNSFQDQREQARLLTIRAEDPAILSLPWDSYTIQREAECSCSTKIHVLVYVEVFQAAQEVCPRKSESPRGAAFAICCQSSGRRPIH